LKHSGPGLVNAGKGTLLDFLDCEAVLIQRWGTVSVTPDEKAKIILRPLSGGHLSNWLPGNDHKAAIAHGVGIHHEWMGGDQCGRVTTKGIEIFPSLDAMFARTPSDVIRWREVIEIVAVGCGEGRREAYEAAFARWNNWARDEGYTIKSAKRPNDDELEASYRGGMPSPSPSTPLRTRSLQQVVTVRPCSWSFSDHGRPQSVVIGQ
jgi:hypothetical protein